MSDTLTLLDATPHWIDALCKEIDTLAFTSAFDAFAPNAVLDFGVTRITGVADMQAFFVKIDSPLEIEHRILEVWDGTWTIYVRGEAVLAKKETPDERITAPFMWLFRRAAPDKPIDHWFVTAGPLKTDTIM